MVSNLVCSSIEAMLALYIIHVQLYIKWYILEDIIIMFQIL